MNTVSEHYKNWFPKNALSVCCKKKSPKSSQNHTILLLSTLEFLVKYSFFKT